MAVYYNEFDRHAAAWLRALIDRGLIAHGDVDSRNIRDVRPDDLRGYSQCHFFAGIGGWAYALRLAGWSDDRPVWTGSCPCQPFSAAGARKGFADDRHLWPEWFRLIRECRPSIVFGEQVARAVGVGWLDAVADDLEREDYAIGAAIIPACAVSAPHERDRLWFVADAGGAELRQSGRRGGSDGQGSILARAHGAAQSVADADRERLTRRRERDVQSQQSEQQAPFGHDFGRRGETLADHDGIRREIGFDERRGIRGARRAQPRRETFEPFAWPPEPDFPRVAHGIPHRVAKLRGLGNAIVPQVAAEFILAASEAIKCGT